MVNPTPVEQQRGWRHFEVERRLLELGGDDFHAHIIALRQNGMKTEPAFAKALQLDGDPYIAILELFDRSDDHLQNCIEGGVIKPLPHLRERFNYDRNTIASL